MKKLNFLILSCGLLLGLCSCGVDGGLLDSNSKASKEQAKNFKNYQDNIKNSLRLDEDAMDWFGNYCVNMTHLRKELDQGDSQGENRADAVKARYLGFFSHNGELAKRVADSIASFPPAEFTKNKWIAASQKIVDYLNQITQMSNEHRDKLAIVDYTNVALLEQTINSSIKNWSDGFKAIMKHINDEANKMPFINEKTVKAIKNLPQCREDVKKQAKKSD